MWPLSRELLTSPLGGAVVQCVFSRYNSLELFCEIALNCTISKVYEPTGWFSVRSVVRLRQQVKILRLLRLLGKNDADTSEAMNDILAQVGNGRLGGLGRGGGVKWEIGREGGGLGVRSSAVGVYEFVRIMMSANAVVVWLTCLPHVELSVSG